MRELYIIFDKTTGERKSDTQNKSESERVEFERLRSKNVAIWDQADLDSALVLLLKALPERTFK